MPIPVSYDGDSDEDDNYNQVSDENHHELMDVVGSLVRPEIHENCMHSAGDVIIWIGERQRLSSIMMIFVIQRLHRRDSGGCVGLGPAPL